MRWADETLEELLRSLPPAPDRLVAHAKEVPAYFGADPPDAEVDDGASDDHGFDDGASDDHGFDDGSAPYTEDPLGGMERPADDDAFDGEGP